MLGVCLPPVPPSESRAEDEINGMNRIESAVVRFILGNPARVGTPAKCHNGHTQSFIPFIPFISSTSAVHCPCQYKKPVMQRGEAGEGGLAVGQGGGAAQLGEDLVIGRILVQNASHREARPPAAKHKQNST